MDAAIQKKVDSWLNGSFDQATKDEITRLQKKTRMNWQMHFTRTWNLVPADSWPDGCRYQPDE